MASNIGELRIDVQLGMETADFKAGSSFFVNANQKMAAATQDTAEAQVQANKAFADSGASQTALNRIMELTGSRLEDMSRKMSALFTSQQRLTAGRREMQAVFGKNLDTRVNSIINPEDPLNAAQLTSQLKNQKSELADVRVRYDAVTNELEEQRILASDLLQIEKQLRSVSKQERAITDPEGAAASLLAQKKATLTQQAEELRNETAGIVNLEQEQLRLLQQGNQLDKDAIQSAKEILATKRQTIALAEQEEQKQQRAQEAVDRRLMALKREREAAGVADGVRGNAATRSMADFSGQSSDDIERQVTIVNTRLAERRETLASLRDEQESIVREGKSEEAILSRIKATELDLVELDKDRSQLIRALAQSRKSEADEARKAATENQRNIQLLEQESRGQQEKLKLIQAQREATEQQRQGRDNALARNSRDVSSQSSGDIARQEENVNSILERRYAMLDQIRRDQTQAVAVGDEQQELSLAQQIAQVSQSIVELDRERQQLTTARISAERRERQEAETLAQSKEREAVREKERIDTRLAGIDKEEAAFDRMRSKRQNSLNSSDTDLTTLNSDQLLDQQALIESKLQDQTAELTRARDIQRQRIADGKDDVDIQRQIAGIQDGITETEEQRQRIARQRNATIKQEGRSREAVLSILGRLGSTDAARERIQIQINNNAEEFNRQLAIAVRTGQILEDEAEEIAEQFARINTQGNVARQLNQGGGFNNFGAMAQQAAYGLEDFASQIERGLIPALGGAANNINMIAGMLPGMKWQYLTTGAIVALQFANAMGLFADETVSAEEALDNLNDSVQEYHDFVKGLQDRTTIATELKFTTDFSGALSNLGDISNNVSSMLNDFQRDTTVDLGQRIQDSLERLPGGFQTFVRQGIGSIADAAGADDFANDVFAGLDADQRRFERLTKMMADLSKRREELQKQELRRSLDVQKQAAGEANKFANDQLKNITRAGGPVSDDDTRQLGTVQKEATAAAKERKRISDEILKNNERIFTLVNETRDGFSAEDAVKANEDITKLRERQAELAVEQQEKEDILNQAHERRVELAEQEKDARQELVDLASQFASDEEKAAAAAQKTMDALVAASKAITDGGGSGVLEREATVDKMLDDLEDRRAEAAASAAPELPLNLQVANAKFKLDALQSEQDRLEANLALQGRTIDNDRDRLRVAEELIDAQQKLADLTKREAEEKRRIREQSEKAVASTKDQMSNTLIGLADELGLKQQLKNEQAEFNDMLTEAVKQQVLTKPEALKLENQFKVTQQLQKEQASLDAEQEALKGSSRRAESELRSASQSPNQSAGIVLRGSAEAQQIIDRAFREGIGRNLQEASLHALENIALSNSNVEASLEAIKQKAASFAGLIF